MSGEEATGDDKVARRDHPGWQAQEEVKWLLGTGQWLRGQSDGFACMRT